MPPRASPTRISSSRGRSRRWCSGDPARTARSKARRARINASPISNTTSPGERGPGERGPMASVARAGVGVRATFAEFATRADLILLVGSDPADAFPRFHERLVRNPTPLYRAGPPVVAYLGPAEGAPEGASLRAQVPQSRLLDALGALGVELRGGRPRATPDLPDDAIAMLAERLRAARYGAIVWHPASFAPADAELGIERLAAILRHLNVT